ncbi:unnamed protein product, partial [Prorocentrum cordatum]
VHWCCRNGDRAVRLQLERGASCPGAPSEDAAHPPPDVQFEASLGSSVDIPARLTCFSQVVAMPPGKVTDAFVTAAFVALGVYVLGALDKHPMPYFGKDGVMDLGLPDLKFWSPPHAAIAVIMFTANRYPDLVNTVKAIVASIAASIVTVEFGEPFITDQVLLRAVAAGAAMFAAKTVGAVFAPAEAIAILFVDNAALRSNMGRWYILMPGLSGTLVLMLLASIKIAVSVPLRRKAE